VRREVRGRGVVCGGRLSICGSRLSICGGRLPRWVIIRDDRDVSGSMGLPRWIIIRKDRDVSGSMGLPSRIRNRKGRGRGGEGRRRKKAVVCTIVGEDWSMLSGL
jgi:ribosomal protein L39E